MPIAIDAARQPHGLLPWRHLLATGLITALLACSPTDPHASALASAHYGLCGRGLLVLIAR